MYLFGWGSSAWGWCYNGTSLARGRITFSILRLLQESRHLNNCHPQGAWRVVQRLVWVFTQVEYSSSAPPYLFSVPLTNLQTLTRKHWDLPRSCPLRKTSFGDLENEQLLLVRKTSSLWFLSTSENKSSWRNLPSCLKTFADQGWI